MTDFMYSCGVESISQPYEGHRWNIYLIMSAVQPTSCHWYYYSQGQSEGKLSICSKIQCWNTGFHQDIKHLVLVLVLGVESGDQSSSANVIPNTMRPLEKTQTSVMLEFSVNTKTSSRKLWNVQPSRRTKHKISINSKMKRIKFLNHIL